MTTTTKILQCFAAAALLTFAASCSSDDITPETEKAEAASKGYAGQGAFISIAHNGEAATRTSMDWDKGKFFWEADDYIYVRDDHNAFRKISNTNPGPRKPNFDFDLPSSDFTKSAYLVYYPGEKGHNDQVTIAAEQTQTAPNNTDHFGVSGDCGMGVAKKRNGLFKFDLNHKASYLRFLPYTSHQLVSTYITKIEVVSDNNIAGAYTLDPVAYKLIGAGSQKTITLHINKAAGYSHGFPLKNNAPNSKLNSAFMVIAPGKHKLSVKYYVKDIQTGVDGVITDEYGTFDYRENTYYDVKSRLDVEPYDAKAYMWDAVNHYWQGFEDVQPALNGDLPNPNYPQNASDSHNRWFNTTLMNGLGTRQATHAAKDCPNVNEILWYIHKGDPHWDDVKLWTALKHLYKGGLWLKKAYAIASDNGGISPSALKESFNGKDYRQGTKAMQKEFPFRVKGIPQTPPANTTNYFYLPAIDNYLFGEIRQGTGRGMGLEGQYWTSTCYALPKTADGQMYYGAFNFTFKRTHVGVHRSMRESGMQCMKFR